MDDRITDKLPEGQPEEFRITDKLPPAPATEANAPAPRSLPGWLLRYTLFGSAAGPFVAIVVRHYGHGWLSADTLFCGAPVLGAVVGAVCGFVGWAITRRVR
jgi:hypothetical protein